MKCLCKCGKYARADSAASTRATCGHCGRQWLWVNGPHANDWTLVHEPPVIAALTAQRDRLAGLLREVRHGMEVDQYVWPNSIRDRITAALAELEKNPTPTAPTNGEGEHK